MESIHRTPQKKKIVPLVIWKEELQSTDTIRLYCGGPVQYQTTATPFTPCPLPTFNHPSTPSTPQSNGCGTLVHRRAAASGRLGLWVASGQPGASVAPLDPEFVTDRIEIWDSGEFLEEGEAKCGCVHEGLGCMDW